MAALHTLGILSTSFMRNAFPIVLKECLCFLHSAVKLIPNHLNWVEDGWLLWAVLPSAASTHLLLLDAHMERVRIEQWSCSLGTKWKKMYWNREGPPASYSLVTKWKKNGQKFSEILRYHLNLHNKKSSFSFSVAQHYETFYHSVRLMNMTLVCPYMCLPPGGSGNNK